MTLAIIILSIHAIGVSLILLRLLNRIGYLESFIHNYLEDRNGKQYS